MDRSVSSRLGPGLLLTLLLFPAVAAAGPWTRDQGHFFVGLTYTPITAGGWYQPDFRKLDFPTPDGAPLRYSQHSLGFYGELGLVDRWLTVTLEGQPYRRTAFDGKSLSEGSGDWRVGFWSGLVTRPFRLTAALIAGVPIGDAAPQPKAGTAAIKEAPTLPLGDGENDLEFRLSAGHSFGQARRWPLSHYLVAEFGYWLRSRGFAQAINYRLELGTKLPWRFIDRLWIILRFVGSESFIPSDRLQLEPITVLPNPTGIGNGVTYMVVGGEFFFRLYRGLGVSVAVDIALRARLLPAGAAPRLALTYEY